jgi:uncharacterized protein YjbI with pentapeptide repeats
MKTKVLSTILALTLGFNIGHAQVKDNPETPYHDGMVAIVKRGSRTLDNFMKAYEKKHGKRPTLNFEEAPLSGVDFRGLDLSGANFKGADLRGAKFGTVPSGVSSRKKEMAKRDVYTRPAILKGADFSEADMGEDNGMHVNFSFTDLTEANLSDCDMTKGLFVHALMHKANLSGSSLIGASFKYADIRNGDLSEADVEKTTFDYTIVIDCNLEDVDLEDALAKEIIRTEAELEAFNKSAQSKY